MRNNAIQFAVVREDPEVESALVEMTGARRALLIASGGCTALSLQAMHPSLDLTLVDPNPAQLELVGRKASALRETRDSPAARERAFNIGDDSPAGLNACGNFESLFRGLRDFVREFIAPAEELRSLLTHPTAAPGALSALIGHKYWPTAFELFFSDALLNTMFGPDATRHAVPGSYPGYFRRVFERGLAAPGAAANYFLHHVFLGCYLPLREALPPYLALPAPEHRFRLVHGKLDAVGDLGEFDLIALSNIFDWSDRSEIEATARRLRREARPGAAIVFRQLNHSSDFQPLFEPEFRFDAGLEQELLSRDRSLFYSRLNIGRKK